MGPLLQLIGEPPDDQIATEAQGRSGVIQCKPSTPQLLCRPIVQSRDFAIKLSQVRVSQSVLLRIVAGSAITLGIFSTLIFLFANNVSWLLVVRILSGLSTGLGAGAATAWIADDDTALGLLLLLDAADQHAILQRSKFHWVPP
jgi:hypothetical protein